MIEKKTSKKKFKMSSPERQPSYRNVSTDFRLYSAGYTGSRLCRSGTSGFSRIDFDPSDVIFFVSGWKFNLFYTRKKKWFACGDNECGQFGSQQSELSEITLVPELSITPLWAACGDKMTALVATDGQLFVIGSGYGNLKMAVPIDRPIRFVNCGTELVIAIPQGPGIFYSNGGNQNFKYVADDVTFIDCAAGQYHFLAVSDSGVVYSWGKRKACGQGRKFNNNRPIPISFEEDVKFKRCFAYNLSSFLIDENDDIWSCGSNNYGQIGLGRLSKTNTFKKIQKFWSAPIIHIACGDSMTYFLGEDGKLYSCGESDNSRLLMNDCENHRVPSSCEKTSGFNIVFVSAGCSHVIVMVGSRTSDFIVHPIITMLNRSFYCHVPIFMEIQIDNIKKPINMDISPAGIASFGFAHGDIIAPITETNQKGKENTKALFNDIPPSAVIGISQDGSLVLKNDGHIRLVKEEAIIIQKHFKIVERKGAVLNLCEGRSTLKYSVDQSDKSCQVFGFKSGEKVHNEDFGDAIVIGVFGSRLYFQWANDNQKISTALDCSVFNLHNLLEIIGPKERTIERIQLLNGDYINIETSPCLGLQKYGFQVHDIVKSGIVYGKIIGEFCQQCVIREILTDKIQFFQFNNVSLIRRYSQEESKIFYKAFNGQIVQILVNCSEDDKIIPFDRILTKKGFATIIGRATNEDSNGKESYWLLMDNCLKLNAGALLCHDISDCKVIRRIDGPPTYKEIDNTIQCFKRENLKIFPGDVVEFNQKKYLVLGMNEKYEVVFYRRDEENLIISNYSDLDTVQVIFRSDLPCQRNYPSRQSFRLLFDVDSSKFNGLRALPGDRIKTEKGEASVIGFKANDIWIQYDNENGAVTVPQQMIFDPKLFKVIQSVSDSF